MPVIPNLEVVQHDVMSQLGPEAVLPGGQYTVLYLGSKAMEMATGTGRYIDHNGRMLEIAKAADLDTEVMSAYIGLHDMIEGLFSDDEAEQTSTQAFLEQYGNGLETDAQNRYLKSVGYAIGGHHLEADIAEAWRTPTLQFVDEMPDVEEGDRTLIKQAITKELPADTDTVHLEKVLKNAKLMDLDIELLSSIVDQYDVESVLIKTIELIDNLDKPNRPQGNPASTWRDAIEALVCWGPICDWYGYSGLGAVLRGKAYEFFYEDHADVVEKAEAQHAVSQKYFSLASGVTNGALRESYAGVGHMRVESRLKTVGSIEQKFVEAPKYKDADMLPDGIGIRVVVPDNEFNSFQVSRFADNAKAYLESLGAGDIDAAEGVQDLHIELSHPLGIDEARDDRIDNGTKGSLKTYNMTFLMNVNGEQVRFEIQFLGESEAVDYTWGPQSHPAYKARTYQRMSARKLAAMEAEQLELHLRSFLGRAEYLKTHANEPALNPNTWFELIRLLPNLETPLHEVYGVNDDGVMMPKILMGTTVEKVAKDEEGKVILPPHELTLDQGRFLLDLLDPSLKDNERVERAINVVRQRHHHLYRNNGTTPDFEGHILPATVFAATIATISGQRWQGEDSVDLVDIVEATLLHDTLEDTFEPTPAGRAEGLIYMNQTFGPETTESVRALTLPLKPPNETAAQKRQRRAVYIEQVLGNATAVEVKPADREQNHTRDVVNLMRPEIMFPLIFPSELPAEAFDTKVFTDEEIQWVESYMAKTDDHMIGLLEGIPHTYYRATKRVLWKMLAESIRFRREAQSELPETA